LRKRPSKKNQYAQSGIFKKQTGSITYHFQLEVKEGKYRYAFSDFVFHYFAPDRNLKVVDTGKTKPLEDKSAAGWQRLWSQHKSDIYRSVQQQCESLNKAMLHKPAVAVEKEKQKIDW
jgi:hypothetical protein